MTITASLQTVWYTLTLLMAAKTLSAHRSWCSKGSHAGAPFKITKCTMLVIKYFLISYGPLTFGISSAKASITHRALSKAARQYATYIVSLFSSTIPKYYSDTFIVTAWPWINSWTSTTRFWVQNVEAHGHDFTTHVVRAHQPLVK